MRTLFVMNAFNCIVLKYLYNFFDLPAYGSQSIFQTISGPSWSMDSLAPTCSTRLFQLEPKK